MRKTVGVIGGDRRQLYLARALRADGFLCYTVGCSEPAAAAALFFEEEAASCTLEELVSRCDSFIFPLPASRDGLTLNAPLADEKILLDDDFAALFAGKTVYAGMPGKLLRSSPLWERADVRDYYLREDLLVGNAFLTAEGAVALAITEHPGSLGGSRCLVTGFGRIGKALCVMLRGLGARVDCCARRSEQLTAIRALGCQPLEYGGIADEYEVIFNTVPTPVLGEAALARQGKDTLLLELASAPGGFDLPAAERLGLTIVNAPGLPGRMSPKAAGLLLKDTILKMMEE